MLRVAVGTAFTNPALEKPVVRWCAKLCVEHGPVISLHPPSQVMAGPPVFNPVWCPVGLGLCEGEAGTGDAEGPGEGWQGGAIRAFGVEGGERVKLVMGRGRDLVGDVAQEEQDLSLRKCSWTWTLVT